MQPRRKIKSQKQVRQTKMEENEEKALKIKRVVNQIKRKTNSLKEVISNFIWIVVF